MSIPETSISLRQEIKVNLEHRDPQDVNLTTQQYSEPVVHL